jgi:hypothetical protein
MVSAAKPRTSAAGKLSERQLAEKLIRLQRHGIAVTLPMARPKSGVAGSGPPRAAAAITELVALREILAAPAVSAAQMRAQLERVRTHVDARLLALHHRTGEIA